MTKLRIGGDVHLPGSVPSELPNRKETVREFSATGKIVFGVNFNTKRHERIYDADKIWSGEHTILDYAEI